MKRPAEPEGWLTARQGNCRAEGRIGRRWGLPAVIFVTWLAALVPPSSAGVRLQGQPYVSLGDFARRFGLEQSWTAPGQQLRLHSRWTRLDFEADSREFRSNGLRIFLGDPVLRHGGKLYVSQLDLTALLEPILKPGLNQSAVPAARKIALDPGHGGTDPGTANPALRLAEKNLTLDLARRLKTLLEAAGYQVHLTRDDDSLPGLAERAEAAARAGADIFLSLHFNSIPTARSVRGIETYILTPRHQRSTGSESAESTAHPGNRNDHWNTVLGYAVHRQLVGDLEAFDRGLKRARFAVLRESRIPAVLIEGGYLSNDMEARQIGSAAYRQKLAESIAVAVGAYAGSLQRARAEKK